MDARRIHFELVVMAALSLVVRQVADAGSNLIEQTHPLLPIDDALAAWPVHFVDPCGNRLHSSPHNARTIANLPGGMSISTLLLH